MLSLRLMRFRWVAATFLLVCASCRSGATSGRPLIGSTDVINSVAFLPDGQRVVAAGRDRRLRLWNIAEPISTAEFVGHDGNVLAVTPLAEGKFILSSAQDGTVRVWNVEDRKEIFQFESEPKSSFVSATSAPDGQTVATARFVMNAGTIVRVWRVIDRTEIASFTGPRWGYVETLSFSADSSRVTASFTASDTTIEPFRVVVWNVQTGNRIFSKDLDGMPGEVSLSPDGRRLLVGEARGIRMFDVDTGKLLQSKWILSWAGAGISHIRFSPDGKSFLAAGATSLATLYNSETFAVIRQFDGNGAVAFSPDGNRIALARNDYKSYTVRIWSLASVDRGN